MPLRVMITAPTLNRLESRVARVAQQLRADADRRIREHAERVTAQLKAATPIGQQEPGNPRQPGTARGSIRLMTNAGRYALMSDDPVVDMLLSGTKAHVIVPSQAKMLAFKVAGLPVFARRVEHPGTVANAAMNAVIRNARGTASTAPVVAQIVATVTSTLKG